MKVLKYGEFKRLKEQLENCSYVEDYTDRPYEFFQEVATVVKATRITPEHYAISKPRLVIARWVSLMEELQPKYIRQKTFQHHMIIWNGFTQEWTVVSKDEGTATGDQVMTAIRGLAFEYEDFERWFGETPSVYTDFGMNPSSVYEFCYFQKCVCDFLSMVYEDTFNKVKFERYMRMFNLDNLLEPKHVEVSLEECEEYYEDDED